MAVIIRTNAQITSGSAVYLSSYFWLPGTAGGSNADATDALGRFRSFWEAVKAFITSGTVVNYLPEVLAYDAPTGDLVNAFTGIPGTISGGSATGDPLPRQTQGYVTWGTAGIVNNRRVRGRTFVPDPAEPSNDVNGRPSSAYTTALAAGISALLSAGSTATVPVIWHRPVNRLGGSNHTVLNGTAHNSWSVLRSRRG